MLWSRWFVHSAGEETAKRTLFGRAGGEENVLELQVRVRETESVDETESFENLPFSCIAIPTSERMGRMKLMGKGW